MQEKLAYSASYLQLIFLAAQQMAVDLDLLFTFITLLGAATLTRQVRPLTGQAWEIVLDFPDKRKIFLVC